MRVLGLDPGMQRLGFAGVTRSDADSIYELITYGLISNPRSADSKFNEHLTKSIHQIADDLPRVIDIIRPDIIVSEYVPVGRLGSNTELVVAAITTCKVVAYQFGIPWHDVGANTVKVKFTADAKATKVRIRNEVFDRFPIVEERHIKIKKEQKQAGDKAEGLPFDVFDAIAIASVGLDIHGNQDLPAVQEGEESEAVHAA